MLNVQTHKAQDLLKPIQVALSHDLGYPVVMASKIMKHLSIFVLWYNLITRTFVTKDDRANATCLYELFMNGQLDGIKCHKG